MKRLSIRMLEDLRVRNYSPDTQKAYVDRVAKFVAHFGNKAACSAGARARPQLPPVDATHRRVAEAQREADGAHLLPFKIRVSV